jgi:hypothetical protein
MIEHVRAIKHLLAVLVIPSEAHRSRERSGWGSRDIDGKTGGFANGKLANQISGFRIEMSRLRST